MKHICLFAMIFFISSVLFAQDENFDDISFSDEEYLLQKGDELTIEVMEHPEFSKSVRILPDGTIEYPILGNMKIIKMSARELGEIIKHNLEPYVPIPIVTVYITQIYGESINIIGYVNDPGIYQIYEPLDIPSALAKAGGIINLRKGKYIKIIQRNGEILNIKLSELWYAKNIDDYDKNKFLIHAGDTLIVPPPAEFNWSMVGAIVGVLSLTLQVYLVFR